MVEIYHRIVEYDILGKVRPCLWEFWLFLIWRVNLLWLKCSALSFSLSLGPLADYSHFFPLHIFTVACPLPPLPVWPGFLQVYSHYCYHPTKSWRNTSGFVARHLPAHPSLPSSLNFIHPPNSDSIKHLPA